MQKVKTIVSCIGIITLFTGALLFTETLRHSPRRIENIRSYPPNFPDLYDKQVNVFGIMFTTSTSLIGIGILLISIAHIKKRKPIGFHTVNITLTEVFGYFSAIVLLLTTVLITMFYLALSKFANALWELGCRLKKK